MEPTDPTQISKYVIEGFLGSGAMGRVYKAHDPVLNRHVAIKTISAALAGDAELRKRFHREAQAAARLNHPNIITVYDYGEEKDTIYIAMELLEGTDLKDFLGSGALKSLGAKLRIMEQICEGLAFAHSKGVIHRDLKPANVHVTLSGQVKIMDFGLARLDSGDRSKAGVVVGTPNYMSPEQVMGDAIDARTDIFSAGAVFYELLSSKKPFDADSVHGILFQVVHKQPTPVREISAELPVIVAEVVDKALAKDRANRFQTAEEFREALTYIEHALASGRPQEARLSRSTDKTLLPASSAVIPPPRPPTPRPADAVDGTVALDLKTPDPAPRPRPATAARDRSKPPSRPSAPRVPAPRPYPPRPSGGSHVGLWIVLIVVAATAGAAYHYRNHLGLPGGLLQPTPAGPNVAERALKLALVRTKLELANARLQDKDYRGALEVTTEALRLDPGNAEAEDVRKSAQEVLDHIQAAATEAKEAAQAGDSERAGAALSKLLAFDPKHPVALEVSALLNSSFRRQAEEARKVAEHARKEAEQAGAAKSAPFGQAAGLVRDAEGLFRKGSFADATRGFLESRDAFDRARRSMATPAPTAAADLRTAPPPPPPVTTSAATAPPSLPSIVPAPPRRALAVGPSIVQSKSGGSGLAGFEDASVQKGTDFQGRIDVDLSPAEVRAGDAYTIKASFTNLGRKAVKLKEATLTTTINGRPGVDSVALPKSEAQHEQTVPVTEIRGVWEEGVDSWSLQIAVVSDKGDVCKREIKLR
jgi:serine/threonine-protein kinase